MNDTNPFNNPDHPGTTELKFGALAFARAFKATREPMERPLPSRGIDVAEPSPITFRLIIPGRPINRNDRSHWTKHARLKKQLRHNTRLICLETWGTPGRLPKLNWPATITIQDCCKTANLRDTGNADTKPIIDGITDYGLWPDDSPTYVGQHTLLPATKTGQDAIIITITTTRQ